MEKKIVTEATEYTLHQIKYVIDEMITNVLDDDEDDPHHFPVTANNLCICYSIISQHLGRGTPYRSMRDYLEKEYYTDKEIAEFERRLENERKIYIGRQWAWTDIP